MRSACSTTRASPGAPASRETRTSLATGTIRPDNASPGGAANRMGSRVHRPGLAASVAAGLLLLATLLAVLAHRGGGGADNAAARHPHTASTPAASTPAASTPVPSTPAARPAAAQTVMIGPVVLDVPAGWAATTGYTFGDVCIAPQRERPMFGGCSGLQVFYGWDGFLPGEEMGGFSRRYPGWYHATDVQPCPVDPRGGDDYNGVQTGRQIGGEQLRPVGNRRAYYYRWIAGCQESPYTFSPRAWYLPVSQVLMFDYIGYADVEPVIAHARFDDGSWQVGFVRHAGNSSIEF